MRHQRVPPTEKKGRVHTSTVTVAVLAPKTEPVKMNHSDVSFRYTRSSGNGGQNVNKLETAVIATHKPTGLQVRCEQERFREKNKLLALAMLAEKVEAKINGESAKSVNETRKAQLGSGERGDKVRTIRWQDGIVKCDITGVKKPLNSYLAGDIVF